MKCAHRWWYFCGFVKNRFRWEAVAICSSCGLGKIGPRRVRVKT